MLGTLDAWLTTHLSQQTSVLYCRLSDFKCFKLHNSAFVSKRGIVPKKKKDFHHIGKKKRRKMMQDLLLFYPGRMSLA